MRLTLRVVCEARDDVSVWEPCPKRESLCRPISTRWGIRFCRGTRWPDPRSSLSPAKCTSGQCHAWTEPRLQPIDRNHRYVYISVVVVENTTMEGFMKLRDQAIWRRRRRRPQSKSARPKSSKIRSSSEADSFPTWPQLHPHRDTSWQPLWRWSGSSVWQPAGRLWNGEALDVARGPALRWRSNASRGIRTSLPPPSPDQPPWSGPAEKSYPSQAHLERVEREHNQWRAHFGTLNWIEGGGQTDEREDVRNVIKKNVRASALLVLRLAMTCEVYAHKLDRFSIGMIIENSGKVVPGWSVVHPAMKSQYFDRSILWTPALPPPPVCMQSNSANYIHRWHKGDGWIGGEVAVEGAVYLGCQQEVGIAATNGELSGIHLPKMKMKINWSGQQQREKKTSNQKSKKPLIDFKNYGII